MSLVLSRSATARAGWRGSRITYRVLLLGIGAIFALNAAAFVAGAAFQIGYPYQLDYGEGIVMWQASHVFDLHQAYHPIDRYPFIVFHYPPVYHVISRLVALLTGDLLIAGRLVSWLMGIGVAIVAGLIASMAVRKPGPSRIVAAVVTPLLVLQIATFDWIPLMRVDIAGVFFTVLGLFVFLRAPSAVGRVAAGVLFILALFSKQTMIAAPLAVALTLVLTGSVVEAAVLTSVMAVLGLSTIVTLNWSTNGEFARHLFGYHRNPFVLKQLIYYSVRNVSDLGMVLVLALMLPLTAIVRPGAWATIGSRTWWPLLTVPDESQRAKLTLAVYFLVAGALSVLVGRVGAGIYYFLEWNVACCILAGVVAGELLPQWHTRRLAPVGIAVLLMLAVFGIDHFQRTTSYVMMLRGRDAIMNAQASAGARALDEIKSVPGPVLSEDMVLLEKADKEIPWEPFIITQLTQTGMFDENRAVERVKAGWFDLIVVRTLNRDPSTYFGGRHNLYTDRMRAAIRESYQVRERLANGYTIMQPRNRQVAATNTASY